MSKTFRSGDDSPLNPFNVDDDVISRNIISIHDDPHHAARQDVNSLFNFVSKIVRSRSTNFTHSLDLKQVTIHLVDVDDKALRPTYTFLRKIACQMTCDSFNGSSAHESVVGVLEKLKSYRWDAKAVIALSAFALDFGDQTCWLSLMEGSSNKNENAVVELHVFRLAEEEKKPDSTLVDNTLKLIEGIIALEKFFADKSNTRSNLPAHLFEAPRDVYTYWAVFSLLACANNQVEQNMKNKLVEKLNVAVSEIEPLQDLIWRFNAFRNPSSGILQLLKALIYPKDVDHFQIIANNTTKELITMEEPIKKLLLFISDLDNIESEIEFLKLIYNSMSKDKDKKDYKILWVPAVENWTDEKKEKFELLKSLIPWYVVQYLSPIKGYTVLQYEWKYNDGNPILMEVDVSDDGKVVLNKNEMFSNFVSCVNTSPKNFHRLLIRIFFRCWKWNCFCRKAFNINLGVPVRTATTFKYYLCRACTCHLTRHEDTTNMCKNPLK